MVDREKVIRDNAIRGLQNAIEISGALVHLMKEHAKAILAMLKEQEKALYELGQLLKERTEEIERLKTLTAGDNHIPLRW